MRIVVEAVRSGAEEGIGDGSTSAEMLNGASAIQIGRLLIERPDRQPVIGGPGVIRWNILKIGRVDGYPCVRDGCMTEL